MALTKKEESPVFLEIPILQMPKTKLFPKKQLKNRVETFSLLVSLTIILNRMALLERKEVM